VSVERKVRIRDVFSLAFWANYLAILLLTCWLPLTAMTIIAKNAEGKILTERVNYVRVYRSYIKVITGHFSGHATAVALHLLLSFAVCFSVWYLLLRWNARRQTPSEPENSPNDGN